MARPTLPLSRLAPTPAAAAETDFVTLRDLWRWAVGRFQQAGLAFGHGTDEAADDAAFLLLEGLSLPIDRLDPFLDARLTLAERRHLASLVEARITTRAPCAYIVGRAYIRGIPFLCDPRVAVPRPLLGEVLLAGIADGTPAATSDGGFALIDEPDRVCRILDLCTGSGCLAILAAKLFPEAQVDAVDLSEDALAVARANVALHRLEDRVTLHHGDLWAPVAGAQYDLILSNPPYVTHSGMEALTPEHRHEPAMALFGGEDGLDLVRAILDGAPDHLAPGGALAVEVGSRRPALQAERPDLPFLWLETEATRGEVFWLTDASFAGG